MKSFSEINKANGDKGFRPDEHPQPSPNRDIRGKRPAKSQNASMKANGFGDRESGKQR